MKRSFVFFFLFFLAGVLAPHTSYSSELRYPDRPLNLRNARSPKAQWVGALQAGQPVRIGFFKDGWVAVFEPHMTTPESIVIAGYANAKYLKKRPENVKKKAWGSTMHPRTTVNVRSQRSVKSEKVGKITPEQVVLVDFPEDDWVAVMNDRATIRSKLNIKGYVHSSYLLPGPSVEEKAVATVDSEESTAAKPVHKATNEWGEVVTALHPVRVSKKRSANSRFVRTIKAGEKVKIDFFKNGWFAVFEPHTLSRREDRALGYAKKADIFAHEKTAVVRKETVRSTSGTQSTKPIVIKRDPLAASARPAPKADKVLHGVRYAILEKVETSKNGQDIVDLKIYVDVKELPKASILEDFSKSMWKSHRRSGKLLVVHLFLPEMDLDDLAFIDAVYSHQEQLEFWPRRTALYGTRFMDR